MFREGGFLEHLPNFCLVQFSCSGNSWATQVCSWHVRFKWLWAISPISFSSPTLKFRIWFKGWLELQFLDLCPSLMFRLPSPFFTVDVYVLHMTRARRSQVEQQHLISVEKAMEILSEQTPPLIVDHEKLNVCILPLFFLNAEVARKWWNKLKSKILILECIWLLMFGCTLLGQCTVMLKWARNNLPEIEVVL